MKRCSEYRPRCVSEVKRRIALAKSAFSKLEEKQQIRNRSLGEIGSTNSWSGEEVE